MEVGKINTTGIEIERKYLLRQMPKEVLEGSFRTEECDIYYRPKGDLWIRATVVNSDDKEKQERDRVYIETIKKHISPGTCEEHERYLSEAELNRHIELSTTYIKKTRYFFRSGSDIWEVDDFENLKLVMAELEVNSLNDMVEVPKCIVDDLLVEVTGDKAFSNQSMAPPIIKENDN